MMSSAPVATPTGMPPPEQVRRIACLMLNGIGDILCVSPAIQALKERYPDARLTVLVRPHLRGLLEGSPFVDDLLFYETDRPWKRPIFMWQLFRRRFDLWVDLHVPTFNTVSSNARDFRRNAWLMRAARARFRRAYAVPELAQSLNYPVAVPSGVALADINIVETTLALADVCVPGRYGKFIPVSAEDRAWAGRQLPNREGARVALFFGSRQSADLWPTPHVLEFIGLAGAALPDVELVLIGGEHEAALAGTIAAAVSAREGASVRDFIGKAGFGQSAALLERCDAFVSTDSGPMHIADAMSVPTVALFGSKNHPAIWRPLNPRSILVNHPVDCGPCFQATCHLDNKCMRLIEPREALEALLRLLSTPRRPPHAASASAGA